MNRVSQALAKSPWEMRRINRITLAVALSIVAVILIASSFTISLFSLVESSQVKAKVLADNASASLMFQDAFSIGGFHGAPPSPA